MNKLIELAETLLAEKVCFESYFSIGYGGGIFKLDKLTQHGYKIYIQKSLPKYKQLAILAHETGHADCKVKNCKCFSDNFKEMLILSEYHAHKFALKYMLKNNHKKALQFYIKDILIVDDYVHETAAQRVKKLKIFQKCLDFCKK